MKHLKAEEHIGRNVVNFNGKDEVNSPNIPSNNNYQALSQNFRQRNDYIKFYFEKQIHNIFSSMVQSHVKLLQNEYIYFKKKKYIKIRITFSS